MCQALALDAQVVARQVVDNQTTYRIQYERQIKAESFPLKRKERRNKGV